MFKIATLADWFGLGLKEGIRESQRCGASGVQIYAQNELDPMSISQKEIKEIKSLCDDCGQKVTALCAELGGHGFQIEKDNASKIEYLKRTIEIGKELDCNIITTHIGIVPAEKDAVYEIMQRACSEVGDFAKKYDSYIAVETGPEPVKQLCEFIDDCNGNLAVNYDPANLVMVTCDDEVNGVYTAGQKIVHTHAKDGICKLNVGCEVVYGLFADGGIEALNTTSKYFKEMPLGGGAVRWIPYLKALKEVGYDGYLTIEHEVQENAGTEIRQAVDFLNEILLKL